MKLVWDKTGERLYETGVKNGVLYPRISNGTYPKGVAWNGLSSVSESPSGAEATPVYADDIKYLNLISVEEFGATIEAYTFPPEFALCDGTAEVATGVYIGQQQRQVFGMVYKTVLGNDVDLNDYGYKLHLIYGGLAAPSEKAYATINDSPEAITFSWEVTTTPVEVTGFKPTAQLTIDSTKVNAGALLALETILFGSENADPRLPLPDEVAALFSGSAPVAVALVSIDPDHEETDVVLSKTIVMTFNNKVYQETVTVMSEGGTLVAGAKTWNAVGTVLTFTPDTALVTDTMYFVSITGVVDVYNQSLAPVVKTFTTV